jgi:hypothetical protein
MGDPLLAEKIRYHKILRDRLTPGGRSPAQVAAHERFLALAVEASDVMDLQRQIEAENLDFAVSRAMSVDTWNAKAAAARAFDNPELAAAYERVASAAAAAPDFTGLSQAILAAEERAKDLGTRQSGLRYIFIGILYGALEFTSRAPGNAYEKNKLAEGVRDRLRQLAALGADFDDLCRQPFCRRYVPSFTEEQWRVLRDAVAAMKTYQPDAAAVEAVRRAGRELLAAAQPEWEKLSALQREEDARTSRRTCVASRIDDEPGPYEFTTIWERKW